jgi:hypothetical protein
MFQDPLSIICVATTVGALLVVGVALLRAWLRLRTARRHSCCASCGYDLSGLPKAICPECGHAAAAARRLTIWSMWRLASAALIGTIPAAVITTTELTGSHAWQSCLPSWSLVLLTKVSRCDFACEQLEQRVYPSYCSIFAWAREDALSYPWEWRVLARAASAGPGVRPANRLAALAGAVLGRKSLRLSPSHAIFHSAQITVGEYSELCNLLGVVRVMDGGGTQGEDPPTIQVENAVFKVGGGVERVITLKDQSWSQHLLLFRDVDETFELIGTLEIGDSLESPLQVVDYGKGWVFCMADRRACHGTGIAEYATTYIALPPQKFDEPIFDVPSHGGSYWRIQQEFESTKPIVTATDWGLEFSFEVTDAVQGGVNSCESVAEVVLVWRDGRPRIDGRRSRWKHCDEGKTWYEPFTAATVWGACNPCSSGDSVAKRVIDQALEETDPDSDP